jgi:hypothetical protein
MEDVVVEAVVPTAWSIIHYPCLSQRPIIIVAAIVDRGAGSPTKDTESEPLNTTA